MTMRAAASAVARDLPEISRRGLLAGAAAFACLGAPALVCAAPKAPRLAAIDWAMLETALAIGAIPVAAAELVLFRKAAVEPPVPPQVADLGLRGALSYERLLYERPDLILISPWYDNRAHILRRIAPVASFTVYAPGVSPYDAAVSATRGLGARIGREAEAERAIAAAEAELGELRQRLSGLAGRRALIMNLGDARHFRAFGQDSMFGDVLGRLGLELAWTAPTRFGAYPTVGVESLAEMGDATVVNVGPTSPAVLEEVRSSPLWNAMPPVAAGRFVDLAPVNPYGALPAARRFARLVTEGLLAKTHG